MARYLYRTCPKCGDYLGVVVPQPKEPVQEIPIDATCLRCGYKMLLKVVLGNRRLSERQDGFGGGTVSAKMSRNEYVNRYREQRRLRGLCVDCGQKINTGTWRCDACLRKRMEWSRKRWTAQNPLYCRECKKLIKPEERNGGRIFHKACTKRRQARIYPQQHRAAALAYQRRHRELGLCTKCLEEAFKGGLCRRHYEMAKAAVDRAAGRI